MIKIHIIKIPYHFKIIRKDKYIEFADLLAQETEIKAKEPLIAFIGIIDRATDTFENTPKAIFAKIYREEDRAFLPSTALWFNL